MEKKKIILISTVLTGVVACGLLIGNSFNERMFANFTSGEANTFTFNSTTNKLVTSQASIDINTYHGNPITFNYSNMATNSSGWMTLKEGATFYNPKTAVGYYNAITNLSSLTVTYDNSQEDLYISFGWLEDGEHYEFENQKLASGEAFDFYNYSPDYFFIENKHSLSIAVTSMQLTYDCISTVVEKSSPKYTISVNEDNGISYSVGTDEDGDYVLARPYKEGYNFAGWVLAGTTTPFAASGTLSNNVSIEATYTIDGTDTFAKLKRRCNEGVSDILITASFNLTETISVNGDVTIYSQ